MGIAAPNTLLDDERDPTVSAIEDAVRGLGAANAAMERRIRADVAASEARILAALKEHDARHHFVELDRPAARAGCRAGAADPRLPLGRYHP